MPSSNDIRIQCITDSRTLATIAQYFDSVNIPVSSVSDLVRKSLQILATNILDQIDHIPSKHEAQSILQNLSQQSSGFGRNTPYLKIQPDKIPTKPTQLLTEERIQKYISLKPGATREEAIKMINNYDQATKMSIVK